MGMTITNAKGKQLSCSVVVSSGGGHCTRFSLKWLCSWLPFPSQTTEDDSNRYYIYTYAVGCPSFTLIVPYLTLQDDHVMFW